MSYQDENIKSITGCLIGTVSIFNKRLSAVASLLNANLRGCVYAYASLKALVTLTSNVLKLQVYKSSNIGTLRCGVVCSIENAPYVLIPQECIWLMPENNNYGEIVVYSNIEWIVK